MTEADFNQIRLIVTDAIAASEGRMLAAMADAIAASEKRILAAQTDTIAASEERLSDGLTRAVVELDRRITDLEKRLIERQDAGLQQLFDRMAEMIRQVETNLLTSFHSYAKGQTARVHSIEIGDNDVKIRLAALEDRILNLETRRPNNPPAA